MTASDAMGRDEDRDHPEPIGNEFALQQLLADLAMGRATAADGFQLLAALRLAGDIHRMERLSRALRR